MRVFLLGLFLLMGALAQADSSDVGVVLVTCEPGLFEELQILNYPAFAPLECDKIRGDLEKVLTAVRTLSGVDFPAPKLIILNDEYSSATSYSGYVNVLELKLTAKSDPLKWPVTLAHELGHVLYQYFINRDHPEVVNATVTEAHQFFYGADYNHVQDAYNELYADVVADLLFSDPDAMVKALDDGEGTFDYLSFTKPAVISDAQARDPHKRFAALRQDLWTVWIEPRRDNVPALLEKLAGIFQDESLTHYEQDILIKEGVRGNIEMLRLRERLGLPTWSSVQKP